MTKPSQISCPRCQTPLQETRQGSHVCPRCELAGALAVAPSAESEIAETLGDYIISSLIAHGGMGAVYRAYHRDTGKAVAIKTLLAGRLAGHESRQRFFREARVATQLQHRHIVPTLDVGESDGIPYLVMEEMAGRNLADAVRDGPLAPLEAAKLITKVADAIAHAHERGVLHRDLKPANILLDAAGEPRVTDFGLARLMDGQATELTMSGQMLGSPDYLPPERIPNAGDSRADNGNTFGVTSDVYSLGATLYHLLTGRPPFQAATIEAVLMQVAKTEPISLRKLNPSVPPALEAICLKCLEKEPRRRYSDMRDFALDLERFLDGKPVQARLPGALARSWKWCRRNRALASTGTAVLLLLLIVAVGSPIAAVRINRERQAAATQAAKSRQVATFLASMLEGVKPSVARGRDTALLRDILDRTARRLDTEFKDQPEVEAQLRLVVGQVYEALEFTEQAEQHLRTAWALRRKWLGEQHAETLAAKLALARALEVGHKWSEAKTLAAEVLQVYRGQFGNRDPHTIEALHLLGNALKRGREFEASAAVLRELVALKKEVYGNENPVVFPALEALGCSLIEARQPGEAALVFEESLRGFEKLSLTNSRGAAFALGWLGVARNGQGRFAEADALQRDSLALKRRLLPEDHPSIAWHQYYQAESWLVQARFAETESLLIESWNIAARHTTESLHLKRCLALFADRLYAAWAPTDPAAASKAKEWRDKLGELDRQHPKLREQH